MQRSFVPLLLSLLGCAPLYGPAVEETTTRAAQQRADPAVIPTRSSWNPRTGVLTATITPPSVQDPSDTPPRIPIGRITTYTGGDRWRARPYREDSLPARIRRTDPPVRDDVRYHVAEHYREGARHGLVASLEYTNPHVDELVIQYELVPMMRYSNVLPALEDTVVLRPNVQPVVTIPLPTYYTTICFTMFVGDTPNEVLSEQSLRLDLPRGIHYSLRPQAEDVTLAGNRRRVYDSCFSF